MRRIAPRHRKERTPCPCCMAGVKGIFQLFASRPGTGSAEVRQIIPADAFGSRENSAQAGSTAGRIFRQKVSPRRKAPKTRGRKSPLKKYGRRKERSYEWPVHSPFSFPAGTCQAAGNSVAKQMQSEKCPSKGKACCRTCRCAGGSSEKETYTAHTFCRKREEDEGAQEKEQRNTGGGNLPFPRKTENVPTDRPQQREKTGYGKGS